MSWFTVHFKSKDLPDEPGAVLDINADHVSARVDRGDGGTNLVMSTGEMFSVFEPFADIRRLMGD